MSRCPINYPAPSAESLLKNVAWFALSRRANLTSYLHPVLRRRNSFSPASPRPPSIDRKISARGRRNREGKLSRLRGRKSFETGELIISDYIGWRQVFIRNKSRYRRKLKAREEQANPLAPFLRSARKTPLIRHWFRPHK